MPAHNVNTAALEQVVDAARRFEQLTKALNLAPVDEEDFPLSAATIEMENVLAVADGNGDKITLENGRKH